MGKRPTFAPLLLPRAGHLALVQWRGPAAVRARGSSGIARARTRHWSFHLRGKISLNQGVIPRRAKRIETEFTMKRVPAQWRAYPALINPTGESLQPGLQPFGGPGFVFIPGDAKLRPNEWRVGLCAGRERRLPSPPLAPSRKKPQSNSGALSPAEMLIPPWKHLRVPIDPENSFTKSFLKPLRALELPGVIKIARVPKVLFDEFENSTGRLLISFSADAPVHSTKFGWFFRPDRPSTVRPTTACATVQLALNRPLPKTTVPPPV
jgi:hypothetical protein